MFFKRIDSDSKIRFLATLISVRGCRLCDKACRLRLTVEMFEIRFGGALYRRGLGCLPFRNLCMFENV